MTDENQFPGNPKISKTTERVPREAIVSGEVVIRKKSIGRKIKDIFFGGDFKNAARYVAAEVALPAFRNMVVDTVTKGVERVIFGPDRASQRSRTPNYSGRTIYNAPVSRQYSSVMLPHQPPYLSRNARMDLGDLIFPSREEAEGVLEMLGDIIDKEKVATKMELMEICGRPTQYTDQKWGWSFIGNAEIIQIREGWLLDLPPMEPIP
jgi:hypothetical protein